MPFTIIGSDGGYLPAPQVITTFTFAITERADILVDFSQFPAGTQIIMQNVGGTPAGTLDRIMRFTVQNTTPVTPPALNPALFPPKPALPTNAPTRIKTFHNLVDANLNAERSVDGLPFSAPDTEFPLVGSTEQWDILNIGGGGHQIHLHLIEFQVVSRQSINTAAYLQEWQRLNGFRPVTRPIVVDPTPFLLGSPVAAPPIESGWKDTVRAPSNQLTRILARWAPQETVSGGVSPGRTSSRSIRPRRRARYLWHCHVLGHEDNDMMRRLPIAPLWAGNVSYPVGRVVTHLNINYRIRVAHTSVATQPPPTRFDRYERVNNNDGTWQPQIIYAVGDRVLFNGQLFRALSVFQALAGQTPSGESRPVGRAAQDRLRAARRVLRGQHRAIRLGAELPGDRTGGRRSNLPDAAQDLPAASASSCMPTRARASATTRSPSPCRTAATSSRARSAPAQPATRRRRRSPRAAAAASSARGS